MGVGECLRISRIVFLDIFLNSFNLILTFININLFLSAQGTAKFGYLSLFFLWFPGLVTSVGFLFLYFRGVKAVAELKTWKLVLYPLTLLLFYPVLPVVLTVTYLIKKDDRHYQQARLARLFSSFLDHGPQFVLRVVVVVLNGIPHRGMYYRDDVLFGLSMVASFLSQVMSALFFNERKSKFVVWMFVSTPMFAAIFGCRAFTLAVFVREVLEDGSPLYLQFMCAILFILMVAINIALFRWCGQDWIRSVMSSVSSLLLPAGYNNDELYYQLPNQNLLDDQTKIKPVPMLRRELSDGNEGGGEVDQFKPEENQDLKHLVPMKSGQFLLSHILVNSLLLGACSLYIYFSSDLPVQADEALVIPQILCVIPGLCFAIGRGCLHDDILPVYEDNDTRKERLCGACQKGFKIFLTVLFTLLGFASLIPAVLWTIVYKIFF